MLHALTVKLMQLTKNGRMENGSKKKCVEGLICNSCKSKDVKAQKSSTRNVLIFIRTKLILRKQYYWLKSVEDREEKEEIKTHLFYYFL